MKKLLLFICFLAFLLGNSISVEAQPAQKLVNVVVSPDRTDWKYKAKDLITFTVQVFKNENLLKDVVIDYETGPECFPTEMKQNILLENGTIVLKASMKSPGFLRCRVTAKVDGRNYEGMATVAIDENQISPTTANPKDFEGFWTDAIREARNIPLNPLLTLLPEKGTSTQNAYHISFQNEC